MKFVTMITKILMIVRMISTTILTFLTMRICTPVTLSHEHCT